MNKMPNKPTSAGSTDRASRSGCASPSPSPSPSPGAIAARSPSPLTPALRKLRIGELAHASGMGVHTIRWYESRRLIPGVRRNEAGHRMYGEWHIAWLALLDRLKRTGMSVAQMVAYADLVRRGDTTLAAQRDLFVQHRQRAAADLAERQQALQHIDAKIAFLERWMATGERPPLGERPAAAVPRPAGARARRRPVGR